MRSEPTFSALIGAGSNLGDRLDHLRAGLGHLRAVSGLRLAAVSPVYLTPPWGLPGQPDFFNLVAAVETSLRPRELLELLHLAEKARGRVRPGVRYGPRTLDLDLLFWENETRATPELTLPHPRWRERAFVVWPLRDVLAHTSLADSPVWKNLRVEAGALEVGPRPPVAGILPPFDPPGT